VEIQASSSATSTTEHAGPYDVFIPNDVEKMWVFYQKRGVQHRNPDGCERPPNADPISPAEVIRRMGEFVEYASRNNVSLIFTARSPSRGWVGAAQEIRINGKRLKPNKSYWCNGVENEGHELVP